MKGNPMSENKPIEITDDDFEELVLDAKGITVVDFWAPWCGPCHSMVPALASFAAANTGNVKVFKLDVDDNPKTAEKYEIKSIPTIIFFQNGKPRDVTAGALTADSLQTKLDNLLKNGSP